MNVPDPNTVANVAAMLGAMSIENACDALKKIMTAITAGMTEHGWDRIEALEFSIRFADAVVAEVQAMPRERVLH